MVPTTCGEASQHHNQEHLEMCEGTGYKSRGLDMIGLSGILDFWRRMTSRLNGGLYMYRVDQKKVCSQKTKIGHSGGFLKTKSMTNKINKIQKIIDPM